MLTWPTLDAITRRVGADALMGAVQAIYDFPKPSIARVHGATVGGGVGIMLACDFAIAVSDARFGLTSARNGLLAGIAIPVLIQAVGPRLDCRYDNSNAPDAASSAAPGLELVVLTAASHRDQVAIALERLRPGTA